MCTPASLTDGVLIIAGRPSKSTDTAVPKPEPVMCTSVPPAMLPCDGSMSKTIPKPLTPAVTRRGPTLSAPRRHGHHSRGRMVGRLPGLATTNP